MIELTPLDQDDPEFLLLLQRIVNGAVSTLEVREAYVVQIDNWFDFKWLGWWSWTKQNGPKELCVPPFNPNRVRIERRFIWDAGISCLRPCAQDQRLHVRQPGRSFSFAKRLDRVSKSAAFIWYSGNSITNTAGSLMLYLSGAEGYAWYASFARRGQWQIDKGYQITRKELVSFESVGRKVEPAFTSCGSQIGRLATERIPG